MQQRKKGEPSVLVLFGATGDLARKKLLPALLQLHTKGIYTKMPIICIGKRDITLTQFFTLVNLPKTKTLTSFKKRILYHSLDLALPNPDAFCKLLKQTANKHKSKGKRIFYFSLSPNLYQKALAFLETIPCLQDKEQQCVFEKPFGTNLTSAKQLNKAIKKLFHEKNIYRVDHYLGKELVQNILVLRFVNPLFANIWDRRFIDHVQITLSETIGVQERGEYYDATGAAKDMVQNHMLQLLALTAMEPPKSFDVDAVRDKKVQVLRQIGNVKTEDVVLGQYTKGVVDKKKVKGYRQETNVAKTSSTETFIALKTMVKTQRFRGVPFYLKTGKRLNEAYAEINVVLKKSKLRAKQNLTPQQNIVSIRISPDQGIAVLFNAKPPETTQIYQPVTMEFCYPCEFGAKTPEAYETLFEEIFLENQAHFTRWDGVKASWRFTDKLTTLIKMKRPATYKAGTSGPRQSDKLLQRDGRVWYTVKRKVVL